jgi:hypothetical protein
MTPAHPTPPPEPAAIHLELAKVGVSGQSLGLRPGDKLVGLDGEAFTGGKHALRARFSAREDKRVAMHFLRGDIDLTVVSVTPKLGRWMPCPVAGTPNVPPVAAEDLDNWEILRSRDGSYDLFRHRASPLVWMITPLWLAQMRLWPHLASFFGMVAVGYPIGLWMCAALWALGAYYVHKNYAQILRSDRIQRGMFPYAIIAARGEMGAHATHLMMQPDDSFAFGKIILTNKDETPQQEEEDGDLYEPVPV